MKRLLLILAIGLGIFYIQLSFAFSEANVMRWISEHDARAASGDAKACDDFSDNMQASVIDDSPQGRWEIEGGKDEICAYIKQSSAAFVVLQASASTAFDQVQIERGGFPWTTVQVKYHYKTTLQAQRIPTMTMDGNDTLILAKGFSGLKIKSLDSKSTTTISR